MYPIYHFIFTVLASLLLWPILGWKLALFWLGSFFVDVDHYIWEVFKSKDISFMKAYRRCKNKSKGSRFSFDFHVFHLVEFWILMLVWGMFSELGFVIFLGLIFHMVLDFIDAISKETYNKGRPLSFFEWIYS